MKHAFAVLASAAVMLTAPSAANAATQLVSPAGVDSADCTVTPCLHIQQAVNVAAANDTISIAPGTYDSEPNNQVVVTKGLTITGAGLGQTILDGNGGTTLVEPGTLSIQTATSDPVSVSGLTVREPGAVGAAPKYAIFTKSIVNLATAPDYTFDGIRVEGGGGGANDYNFYAVGSTADLEIANSQFVLAANNPILLERQQGPSDVHDNTITKSVGTGAAYFNMNYAPGLAGVTDGFAAPQQFRNNSVVAGGQSGVSFNAKPSFVGGTTGGYDSVEVSGNTISGLGATGIGVSINNDSTDPDGSDAEIKNADVSENEIFPPGATGLRFRGLVNGIDVTRNQIDGAFVRSIQFTQSLGGAHAPGPSEVHRNRLTRATGQGIEQTAGAAVDAENNWYGCNEGPNADPGCTSVVGAGVDFDPWLVLRVTANPTSIPVGGSNSALTADTNVNSDGVNAGTAFFDGFPAIWATDLGSLNQVATAFTNGVATNTLTSGAIAGTANPRVTLDNEVTSTPVQFVDNVFPDTTITSGPTNGVTIAQTSASFAFNSPNDPVATFQCRIDSSNPADWAACTSPQAYSNLAQGPHVFEVRAVDINNNPDPSPARGVFTVDTTPSGGTAGDTGAGTVRGACDNRIAGDAQPNNLRGTNEGDRLLGFGADDSLGGVKGYDCLKGGKGDDALDGGLAGDILQGGPGDDAVESVDGKRDKINCGPGRDAALVDQRDVVKSCEALRVVKRK